MWGLHLYHQPSSLSRTNQSQLWIEYSRCQLPTNHHCSFSFKQVFAGLISESHKTTLLRANFKKSSEDTSGLLTTHLYGYHETMMQQPATLETDQLQLQLQLHTAAPAPPSSNSRHLHHPSPWARTLLGLALQGHSDTFLVNQRLHKLGHQSSCLCNQFIHIFDCLQLRL